MMELKEVINIINKGARHKHYERTVKLAREYKLLSTGENPGELLKRFVKRETEEEFKQRCDMTMSITPAVFSSLSKPFYKVSKNDKVAAKFKTDSPIIDEAISEIRKSFYGSKFIDNQGLDAWLRTRFIELTFLDPNAWIVYEWKQTDESQAAKVYPFEVPSSCAINFKIEREDLKWLLIKTKYHYNKIEGDEIKVVEGDKYTLYTVGKTFTFCPYCKEYRKKYGIEAESGKDFLSYIKIGNKEYYSEAYNTNLSFVPAVRVGYNRDAETNGDIFVNPIHSSMPFFMKSVKTVSEMDLTMSLHAFPQKFAYVEKCEGESIDRPCRDGYISGTKDICRECKGTGKKFHTSAQDIITLDLPDSKDDVIPLNELTHYERPPIDILEFQDSFIKDLKVQAHEAVYNTTALLQSSISKTATEVDYNMQGVYDTLEPFTEKFSSLWKTSIKVFAHISGLSDNGSILIYHRFPSDLKLKSTAQLISELAAANESGAPSFVIDAINDELADALFADDNIERKKLSVKKQLYPFNGKTPDEITMLLATDHIMQETKILYANFERIITDLEIEHEDFYDFDIVRQRQLVDEKTMEYKQKLEPTIPNIDFERDTIDFLDE